MEGRMHLIIDGYTRDKNILQDESFLSQILHNIPDLIGMTRITEPFVFRYLGEKPEEWGYSGFVFIAESHISFHTFVEQNFINIDVFSCKDFDTELATKHLKEQFHLNQFKTFLINRDWNPNEQAKITQLSAIKTS
jgi:S-adenosylmethionine decarboxylase